MDILFGFFLVENQQIGLLFNTSDHDSLHKRSLS